jgi:hypothetical protein
MRSRDVRAVGFWVTSTIVILCLANLVFRNWLASGSLAAAYSVWVLTRPRMVRVFRRLCGETVEREGYFRD